MGIPYCGRNRGAFATTRGCPYRFWDAGRVHDLINLRFHPGCGSSNLFDNLQSGQIFQEEPSVLRSVFDYLLEANHMMRNFTSATAELLAGHERSFPFSVHLQQETVGDLDAMVIRVGNAVDSNSIGDIGSIEVLEGGRTRRIKNVRFPTLPEGRMYNALSFPILFSDGALSPIFVNITEFERAMAHCVMRNPIFQETSMSGDFLLEMFSRVMAHRQRLACNQLLMKQRIRFRQRGGAMSDFVPKKILIPEDWINSPAYWNLQAIKCSTMSINQGHPSFFGTWTCDPRHLNIEPILLNKIRAVNENGSVEQERGDPKQFPMVVMTAFWQFTLDFIDAIYKNNWFGKVTLLFFIDFS